MNAMAPLRPYRLTLAALLLIVLAGCNSTPYKNGFPPQERWAVLPIQSLQSEELGIQIERMMTVLLASKGIAHVELPPQTEASSNNPVLESAHRLQNATEWASQHGYRLGLSGTVYNYETLDDNRFLVALTLNLVDIKSGEVLWTTSGQGEGRPGDDHLDVTRRLVSTLLSSLPLQTTDGSTT